MLFIFVPLIIFILIYIIYFYKKKLKIEKTKISIKESLDLIGLPIITLNNNTRKFNFILDSGSNISLITANSIKNMVYRDSNSNIRCTSLGGETDLTTSKFIDLSYRNIGFTIEVHVSPQIEESFRTAREQYGVTIHGILGSDFLKEYKYILDFAELKFYKG
jgi:hypothetical protein